FGVVQVAADLRQGRFGRGETRFRLTNVGNVAAAALRPGVHVAEGRTVNSDVLLGVEQTIALPHDFEIGLDRIETDELGRFADAIGRRTHARFLALHLVGGEVAVEDELAEGQRTGAAPQRPTVAAAAGRRRRVVVPV